MGAGGGHDSLLGGHGLGRGVPRPHPSPRKGQNRCPLPTSRAAGACLPPIPRPQFLPDVSNLNSLKNTVPGSYFRWHGHVPGWASPPGPFTSPLLKDYILRKRLKPRTRNHLRHAMKRPLVPLENELMAAAGLTDTSSVFSGLSGASYRSEVALPGDDLCRVVQRV